MPAPEDDWRRRGQAEYLTGATFTWRNYRERSTRWEHEHCEMCWAKFVEPSLLEELRAGSDDHTLYSAGFTTTADDTRRLGEHWVCAACVADFADEFSWRCVESDPDAWPYDPGHTERHDETELTVRHLPSTRRTPGWRRLFGSHPDRRTRGTTRTP